MDLARKTPKRPRSSTPSEPPVTKVTPVERKIGEDAGNLRARAAAFKRRRERT
jgi:hypothetical protein